MLKKERKDFHRRNLQVGWKESKKDIMGYSPQWKVKDREYEVL